jgi:hypothetical protein|tara:strand:- start:9257 stop:9526 length:270 start_codon:yes stop_codon:yes gene_type:complete
MSRTISEKPAAIGLIGSPGVKGQMKVSFTLIRRPLMDRIDGPSLFLINILLLLAISVIVWGPSAILIAALIGTPLALGAVVLLSLTAKA